MNNAVKTSIEVSSELTAEAEALGIDVSTICTSALKDAIQGARHAAWIVRNREAFENYDRFVERYGLVNDGKRLA